MIITFGLIYLHFDELYSLKQERGWWVGTKHIICIDTEVSRLKNTFMVSKKWFIIPLVISSIPVVAALLGSQDLESLLLSLVGICIFVTHYSIYIIYGKSRTKAYSDNTEVNIVLNHVYKREWSTCLLILAIFSSILYAIMPYIMSSMAGHGQAIMICTVVLCLGIAIYTMPFDFGSVSFEISEHSTTIHAPFREFSFSTSDIVSVTIIEYFPHAVRINGTNGARVSAGVFDVAGYGKSYVFVHRNIPPFIVIKLDSGLVFLNGDSETQTQMLYNNIRSKIMN